jgi:hypothetical protein
MRSIRNAAPVPYDSNLTPKARQQGTHGVNPEIEKRN